MVFPVALFACYQFFVAAPESFPVREIVSIDEGTTVDEIAALLADKRVIRSADAFTLFVLLVGKEEDLQAGEYFFTEPFTMPRVALAIIAGEFGLEPLSITIPEGATSYEIAALIQKEIVNFDAEAFAARARTREGYLFPDTYFILPNASIDHLLATMEENFYSRIEDLTDEIAASGHSLHDIITMASLLEKEARKYETRRMIAGILWHRLRIDMPLQVDAVFGYIQSRGIFHPSFEDLKVDSPYNVYRHKGLPPGPIANPGLESIRAALHPVDTDYLFYLTDREGVMRYARTFKEHVDNKFRYLK